jgi:2-polyprenyl-6-methoxyphenol hydroxylase-like FAD-dependent oxidoreductase
MGQQVLIVGAGPVGLTLAAELARYGVGVRIVDKAAQRTDKSKALVLWSRTLELMDRGIGTRRFLDAGFKMTAVNIIAAQKPVGHVDMSRVDAPYPYALMIPQSETERLLEERLQELGPRVERGTEVTRVTNGPDGTQAMLRHADGREEAVSADWLVGCDGAHSIVRHALGATFDGATNPSDWMLADVHMTGYPVPDTEASVYWHQDGAFVIFPITPGRYRVIADLPASGEAQPPAPTLDQVQAIMDRRGPGNLKAFDPIWLAGFRINGRKVSQYRWGRTFLAGDAAHVHSPAGGQGMNTGMQDAFNLAWKLALVVSSTCDESLLDSYSPERSHVGDQVLKSAGALTRVATLRNPVAQALRNAIAHLMIGLAPVQHAFADNITTVSVGYPESPLNGPSIRGATPKPGRRLVPAPGQISPGAGTRPRFALFAEPSTPIDALLKEFHALVDANIRPPLAGARLWLVRPDGYVACSANTPDDIAAYLRRLARTNA